MMTPLRSAPGIALAAALALVLGAGCNMLTGASDLALDGEGSGANSTLGAGGSGLGHPGPGGAGSSGGSSTGGSEPSQGMVLADGVYLDEIAIFQGVKRPLMQGGVAAGSAVSVVANRDGLLRVYAHADGAYDGGVVTARLTIGAGPAIDEQVTVGGMGIDGNLASTINFQLPGAVLQPGVGYSVQLLRDPAQSSGANAAAGYPPSGQDSLAVESSGSRLRVALLPIEYDADGSGRLPDTSGAQVEAFRQGFLGRYPVPAVEVTVLDPMPWSTPVTAYGDGWDSLLTSVADLRSARGVGEDEYMFGMFDPAGSIGEYCGGGCVAGLGFVPDAVDVWGRAAIGLGYGEVTVETALHEIGHTHGRQHAPCGGPAGVDPSYPYPNADIGSWGYDIVSGQLLSPGEHVDMMSYCSPTWLSDYTYQALFERIRFVNGAKIVVPDELKNRTYDRVRIGADGSLRWLPSIQLEMPPMAQSMAVELQHGGVSKTVQGSYYPFDHLPGGVLFVARSAPFEALRVHAAGQTRTLLKP